MLHPGNISIFRLLILLLVGTLLYGCETIGYYKQMGVGHFQLMSRAENINRLLEKDELAADTRSKLQLVRNSRQFASENLALPDNDSYQTFSDIERDYVTWMVIATEPYSMTPVKSCFPITGCLSYRGYFSKADAENWAARLQAQGYETWVGGSSAYSTLGWFADPLPSPMLRYHNWQLMQTLFHELAHQQLYFKDDSDFNEAFATLVGESGVRQWLRRKDTAENLQRYQRSLEQRNAFFRLLRQTANELRALYANPTASPPTTLQHRKQQILADLNIRYKQFRKDYGTHRFDGWFEKPVNNPRLALIAVYHDLVPDFDRWLAACNHNYRDFYRTMASFNALNPAQRRQKLAGHASCHRP